MFKKILETLFYVNKEGCPVDAELIVIIVRPENRSMGDGGNVLKRVEDEFVKKGIRHYKVTVHHEMKKSNHFYLKNGFSLFRQFTMYGILWNLYTKEIR